MPRAQAKDEKKRVPSSARSTRLNPSSAGAWAVCGPCPSEAGTMTAWLHVPWSPPVPSVPWSPRDPHTRVPLHPGSLRIPRQHI